MIHFRKTIPAVIAFCIALPSVCAATPQEARRNAGDAQERTAAIKAGKIFTDCAGCPEMVVIPAGSFEMGSTAGYDAEMPVHRVTLAKAFAISRHEVTQGQWQAVMQSNPSELKDCGVNCPVDNVSWNDVQEFTKRFSARTGKQYRLPTEAEWEYACRAGQQSRYCGGNDAVIIGWHSENSNYHIYPVGQSLPNAFGLYDMSGNVWEWVQDSLHDNYTGAPTDGSEWLGDGVQRVLRGGSFDFKPEYMRAAIRIGSEPSNRSFNTGFRIVRELP